MPISNSDISIGYEKISNYIKSIADGSKNVTDILNNLSDVVKKTNRDITGSLADTLGLTNKDKLGKLGSKWVQNYKKSLQERQESYGFTFYEGAIDPALINKKYATGSLAKEKISEYNQLIRQLKSEDVTISGQANDSIQNLIESLKKSNSELGTYLENARNAVKDDEGNDNIESLQELNDEDFMSTQREEIKKILSGGGVRQVIEEYNALSDASGNVSNDQQTMIDALRGTDDALADFLEQHPAATMGQYARAQAVATLKTMALEAATAALNAAISFGLSVAFQALTTGIMSVINRYNDLREANLETMQSFEDTASAIDDYKEKIEELYKVMNDESSTTNEVYDAKSDLLDIQRELTDTYGDQAKSIDLVNGELEEEKKLLDEIERKKAEDTYNSTVSSYEDSKKKLEKEHGSGLLRTGNYSISSGLFGNFGDGDITELMKSDIAEQIKQLGFDVKFGDLVFDKKVSTKDAIEKYNELINLIEKSDDLSQENATALKEAISDNIYNLNSEEYQSWFTDVENTSWAAIRKDEKLYGKYTDIEDAINEYDEALKNGDKAGAEKQLEVITELQKKMKTMEFDDEYIKQHFVDLFDDIQNDLDKREFKIKITQKDDKFNSRFLGMGNRATSTNDYFRTMFKGYSDIDIERIRLSGGTAKEEEAYKKLTELADEYEISVDEAVDVLVELGIVFSRDAEAAKYTTTSYSAMLEEVNDLSASLSKFDDAQSKILSGSKLTSDEINELIRLYPELTSSVQRTSDGYVVSVEELQKARNSIMEKEKESLVSDIAQSRKDLSEIRQNIAINKSTIATLSALSVRTPEQNAQLNTAKSALEVYEEAEMNINRQLEQQLFLFDQLQNPFEDWVDLLDDAASKFETITDQILKMRTQMSKLGSIDPTAALDFMQNVPNWQEYLSIDGGKITFNDMDNTALAEMIKKSSGLDAVYSEISGNTDKVTAANAIFEAKLKSVKSTLGGVNTEGKTSAEILSEMQASGKYTNKQLEEAAMRMGQAENGITATGNAIEKSEDELSFLDEVLKSIIESFKSSDAVNEFNDAVADLDHALAMGWITQDQYDAGFSGALSTLKTNAADNDEEAQDLIDDGLEKEHDAKLAKMQRDFDAEKLLIDNAREDLQKSVLEYRDAYAALNEAYYAPGTTLGNTEDGKKQYAANLREIEKLSSEAYDNITSRFQSAIDFGKIIDPNIINDLADVFKGQELPDAVAQVIQKGIETGIWNATDLATIAPYLTEALLAGSDINSEAYQNAINQQKDYIISAFEYEKTQLDNQLEAGLISSGDFIDEYTKLWEKYYKDKKEFAEEDLQTQKDILEAHKSEIQKQIDALEAYSENQTEPYQNEIDALNDVKDAYDDMMDDRIDALEEEKKAIEKKNEEQEEANDLQEKWLNLQKASMNKRLVYMGNGGWQLKRDEEEYNNAKKEYDEAKKEDATAKIDEAIEKLEEEKEARDKAIDREIEERNKAIDRIQTPIDNLTKALTRMMAEQNNIDPQFLEKILNSKNGTEALDFYNQGLAFSQQQEAKYGVDVPNNTLTVSDAKTIAEEAAKNNQTSQQKAENTGLNLGGKDTNTSAAETKDNTKSTDANTDAINKNTEAVEKAAATTTDTTADATETNKNLDANSYLINSNGKQVLNDGKPIKPLTHDEWAKKHKVSEWATPGRSVNENMTMEQYETLKKGQKNKIIPASIVDIADITDEQLKQFLEAIQSNTKITPQNISPTTTTTTATAAEAINQNVTNAPIINQTITIEGSADKKTIAEFKTVMDDKLVECMNYLGTSMNNAFMRQINKS